MPVHGRTGSEKKNSILFGQIPQLGKNVQEPNDTSLKNLIFCNMRPFQIKYLQKRDSGMYECQVHKSHHPSPAAQNCKFVDLDKYFEYTRVGLDFKPRFLSKLIQTLHTS